MYHVILVVMRLFGVNLPDRKSVFVALTYIQGVGRTSAMNICKEAGVNQQKKAFDLTDEELSKIVAIITKNYTVEGELRKQVMSNKKFLQDIGCYRGIRHRNRLPVRGQRTNTNARTCKGRARVPVAGKKKAVK